MAFFIPVKVYTIAGEPNYKDVEQASDYSPSLAEDR